MSDIKCDSPELIDSLNKIKEAAKILSLSDTWDVAATDEWANLEEALANHETEVNHE